MYSHRNAYYIVPGLLSSVPVITHEYTTTRTIVIMVDVNEGINCLDKDQLHINTSISLYQIAVELSLQVETSSLMVSFFLKSCLLGNTLIVCLS